jgi:hypothetical protein
MINGRKGAKTRHTGEVAKERRAMPTRNVNLTDELDHFVLQKIESGRYESASEVAADRHRRRRR